MYLAKGHPLNFLFFHYQNIFGSVYDNPEIKNKFLSFISELIDEGELKLSMDGKILEGNSEEQVKIFKDHFPKEVDRNDVYRDIGYLWWIVAAPASAVWIYPDGTEVWT